MGIFKDIMASIVLHSVPKDERKEAKVKIGQLKQDADKAERDFLQHYKAPIAGTESFKDGGVTPEEAVEVMNLPKAQKLKVLKMYLAHYMERKRKNR